MIKKLAIILLLVGLFCYFIAAVTVLNKPKEGLVCNGVEVVVEDSLQTGFIQSGEVLRLLESRKCNPTGQKMDQVMLSRIEEALRKNPYIEDVTSYKTPGGTVCVRVKQRLPTIWTVRAGRCRNRPITPTWSWRPEISHRSMPGRI